MIRISISGKGNPFFVSSKRPECLWDPTRPCPLGTSNPWFWDKKSGPKIDHWPQSNAETKNTWGHLSTRPVCLYGEHQKIFTLSCLHVFFFCIIRVCLHFLLFLFNLFIILYRVYSCCLLSHLVQEFHWYLANPVLVRVLINATDTLHSLCAWRMPYLRQLEECGYNLAASPRASAEEMYKTFPHTDKRIYVVSNSVVV